MGFEDVKTDNLSVEELREQIKNYNKIYFGSMAFLADNGKEGQLDRYEKAENQFRKRQESAFKEYFRKPGWDESGDTMRANDSVSVTFDQELDRLILKTSEGETLEYGVTPISDFNQNPHFRRDKKNWKIVPIGGIPIKVQMLQKWVQDLKETIEANQKLNGQYNFRIVVNEDVYGYHSDYEQKEYSDITEFLQEISKTKF